MTTTKEYSFLFWQKWLFYTSLLFAMAGIAFALFGNNFLFQPYNTMLAKLFWHSAAFPAAAERFRAFIYAPLGATIACCYILYYLRSLPATRLKTRNAGPAMLL